MRRASSCAVLHLLRFGAASGAPCGAAPPLAAHGQSAPLVPLRWLATAQHAAQRLPPQVRGAPSCSCGAASPWGAQDAAARADALAWAAAPPRRRSCTTSGALHDSAEQRRAYTTSGALHDSARERRLLAAQQRSKRRAAAAAAAARPPGAPPPAALEQQQQQGSGGDALAAEGSPLPPAEFELSNEVSLSRVLNHPALIITRAIEWGTVILGYEQATKYTVYDEHGNVVALMAEDETGVGNFVARQLLRTHRSFSTTVFSADGSEVLFKVRRPAYLVSSSMFVCDREGDVIGEVHQRWHPIKRNYDLYLGKRQMASITGSFLAWEFELKDERGDTMALIDRNFQGFAKELFTDAGKYVIHFGFTPQRAAEVSQATLQARTGRADVAVTPMAVARTDIAVIPTVTGSQLVVQHPLLLDERMVALACAISIDYNFFSKHSQTGGLIAPPIIMPIPGGGAAEAGGAAGAGAGAGAAGAGEGGAGAQGAAAAGGQELGGAEAGGSGGFGEEGFSDPGTGGGSGGGGGGGDDSGWTWDSPTGGDSGGGGGGDGEGGGIGGVIKSIWEVFNGGD